MGGVSVSIDQERKDLRKSLSNKDRRDAFVSAYIDETIPFQIRALREQADRNWTQEDLATQAGMKQERISTLENPNYGSYSLRILKQIAAAFDVALMVRFVPFSELAEWKLHLSSGSLDVLSFDRESYFREESKELMDTELKTHVERLLDCTASFIEDVVVVEKFGKETVWSGTVSIYELKGHPKATKAYAWSSPIEGSTKRRYYAVLHMPPIDSPEKAVRASIVSGSRK
jgi:transcriptional regulator with XRE-family HTH domain